MARKIVEITVAPEFILDENYIYNRALSKVKSKQQYKHYRILKKSIDARKQVVYRLRVELSSIPYEKRLVQSFLNVAKKLEVHIVGAGPAGYFAALKLLELGLRPIVYDRGKKVQERRRDLKEIQQNGVVNPDSNYCFGEGGAGTYSDGKLYTRSHKRGKIDSVLQLLVDHGANEDILIDAHPHIGSNKLPKIVEAIRKTIIENGGKVIFNSQLTDLKISPKGLSHIVLNQEQEIPVKNLILATGHSARDVYRLLHKKGVRLESKDFALGVRIEHPQSLIDSIQYGQEEREENLPASAYRLACQVGDNGVFSFCMCPGGLVVPAATAPGEIVVNGMSLSRRDSAFANAGTVTSVGPEDFKDFEGHGVFAGLAFQESVEQSLFKNGDGSQQAPAQRLTDFVRRTLSTDLSDSSYIPGLYPAPLHELLPEHIYSRLARGVMQFGKTMPGYLTSEANVIGIESRTSSPLRIPRDPESLMHPEVPSLYPCGEGAGFAGGILSAAMDGQRVAVALAQKMNG